MNKPIALAAILCLASGTVLASFDGAEVEAIYYFPNTGTELDRQRALVGSGVEFLNFPAIDPRTNIDVSSTNIYIDYNSASNWTGADFNGPLLAICTPGPTIASVAINAATNMAGLDAGRISWDETTVSINWNSLAFDTSTIVSLDVTFGDAPWPGDQCELDPLPVDEPVPTMGAVGLALMAALIALLGLYGVRRHTA